MGTRSLVTFEDEYNGKEIVAVYRQFDGYPSVRGKELAAFLDGKSIVNGIAFGEESENKVNGMRELSALWIMREKSANLSGNVYLEPAGTRGVDEEWIYQVKATKPKAIGKAGKISVKVTDVWGKKVYDSIADALAAEDEEG